MVRSNCDPKKPTLLGIHDYWTGVPTTFDLHCRFMGQTSCILLGLECHVGYMPNGINVMEYFKPGE